MNPLTTLLKTCFLGAFLVVKIHAANVAVETRIAGRNLWVKVVPSLRGQLQGGVAFVPKLGGWVSDSVAPGEEVRWTITASAAKERLLKSGACLDVFLPVMEKTLIVLPGAKMPAVGLTRVPTQAPMGPVVGHDFDVLVVTDNMRTLLTFPTVIRPR